MAELNGFGDVILTGTTSEPQKAEANLAVLLALQEVIVKRLHGLHSKVALAG